MHPRSQRTFVPKGSPPLFIYYEQILYNQNKSAFENGFIFLYDVILFISSEQQTLFAPYFGVAGFIPRCYAQRFSPEKIMS